MLVVLLPMPSITVSHYRLSDGDRKEKEFYSMHLPYPHYHYTITQYSFAFNNLFIFLHQSALKVFVMV